ISLSHQLQWSCERIGREEKESSSPCRLAQALDLRKVFRSFLLSLRMASKVHIVKTNLLFFDFDPSIKVFRITEA
ncbi:unnamed protein product, partial [Musa textilis]